MRSGVPGSAHLKSFSTTSRIGSFKQRNGQVSKSPDLSTMTLPTVLPKLIAFDLVRIILFTSSISRLINFHRPRFSAAHQPVPFLFEYLQDATLWIPEMYELYGPPFKVDKKDPKYLVDGSGERISLMGASREILKELATDEKWRETTVAYVSRTEYPKWAASCLNLFRISEGISMHDIGLEQEIYPGSKQRHFRRIHERTGIEYSEMLFFDNESWNITDVAPMGVVSVHTPRGMTTEVWKQGLEAFGAAVAAKERGEMPKLAIRSTGKKGAFDW
jgi:magnesium-dependent phosphatase 1